MTWEELCDWVLNNMDALVGSSYIEIHCIDFNEDHTIDADGVTIAKDRTYEQMKTIIEALWRQIMMKDLMDTVVFIGVCTALFLLCFAFWGLGYFKGESSLIQKICTQQQYDFCEVIEQQPEYKLKELKQDD